MEYFKCMNECMSTYEKNAFEKKLIEIARTLTQANVAAVRAFKNEEPDLYLDLLPWVLVLGAARQIPTLVNEALDLDPSLAGYDFSQVATKIDAMFSENNSKAEVVKPWLINSHLTNPIHLAAYNGDFDLCKALLARGFRTRPLGNNEIASSNTVHAFSVVMTSRKRKVTQKFVEGLKCLIDDDIGIYEVNMFLSQGCRHEEMHQLTPIILDKILNDECKLDDYFRDALSGRKLGGLTASWILMNCPESLIDQLDDKFFNEDIVLPSGDATSPACEAIQIHETFGKNISSSNFLRAAILRQKTPPLEDLKLRDMLLYSDLNIGWAIEAAFERADPQEIIDFVEEYKRIHDYKRASMTDDNRQLLLKLDAIELSCKISLQMSTTPTIKNGPRAARF